MLMEHWAHRFFELAPETLAVLSVDGQILQANQAHRGCPRAVGSARATASRTAA